MRIIAHRSLSCPLVRIHGNLCIATHSFLNCPLIGIRHNLRIATRNSLSYPPASIRRTLLLRSSSMPVSGKTVLTDAWVLQRGLLFLFIHWFNEGCCVEGGGDKWTGPFRGKGNQGNAFMKGVLTLTPLPARRMTKQSMLFPSPCLLICLSTF